MECFTYNGHIRKHLEIVLSEETLQVYDRHKVSSSQCQTLAVTKIGQATEYQQDMLNTRHQVQAYDRRLSPFREDKVRAILGDELYAQLIMMGSGASATPTTETPNKRPAEDSLERPVPARLRVDNFVDLTGD